MGWQYRQIKRRLALSDPPLRLRFERFCEDAHPAMADMEWSCKLAGERWLPDRFFWLGRHPTPDLTRPLRALCDGIAFAPHGGAAAWDELVARDTASVLVGYAGAASASPSASPQVKLYATLAAAAMPARYREFAAACVPGAPAEPPPGDATVLLAYACTETACAPRLYILYNQDAYRDPAVVDYMAPLLGAEGLQLARSHPRAGVTLRRDGRAIGIGIRPSGLRDGSHPSHALSPLHVPLLALANRHPIVGEHLARVSWVSLALGRTESLLNYPDLPAEINVYAVIDERTR